MKKTAILIGILCIIFSACEGPMGLDGEQGIQGEQGEQGQSGATPWICIDGFWHIGGTPNECNENCTGIPATPETIGQSQLSITEPTRTTYCKDIAFNNAGLIVNFIFGNILIPIPAANYVLVWNEGLLANGSTDITAETGTKTIYVVDFAGRIAEFEITVLEHDYPTIIPATCTTDSEPGTCINESCGLMDPTPVVPAFEHAFSPTIPATCNEDSIPGTCTHEGCGEKAAPIVLAHHDIINGIIITPPDFATLTAGVASGICSICGVDREQPYTIRAIGDVGPGGGRIFYVADGLDGRTHGFTVQGYGAPGDTGYFVSYTAYYLEAAPENFAGDYQWSTSEYVATLNGIGAGRRNTALMNAPAASVCLNYNGGGKSDWFLPSMEELNELYLSKDNVGMGSEWRVFWSSSQYISYYVWNQNFSTGAQYYDWDVEVSVRAVRAF
ncbi:MAG: DUF1566 domain-containing protein [Treponema sp.]|nr:DUF1566 domain-containing protein [Treponema sp.]